MRNLAEIVHNIVPLGHDVPNTLIHGLAMNSNEVNKGDIFIAIPGTRLDGHNFIEQAIDKGASAIISNGKDLGKLPVPQIKVANPRRAASIVASEFYGHPTKHLKVIGITGTNGKTTTASILKSILDNAGHKVAQIGTLGLIADDFEQIKTLTTPDPITLQKLFSKLKEANYSHIVMEVSSHALDQFRVADVDFNIAVFTNLSPEHLDYHAISPLIPFFKQHDLTVFHAERVASHGGSIRIFAAPGESGRMPTRDLQELLAAEEAAQLFSLETYRRFEEKILHAGRQLRKTIAESRKVGRRIAGYGAPAKATTLMHQFGLGRDDMAYIVDDSPWKQGLYTPGINIPIVPASHITSHPVDDLVVLAWNFAEPIIENNRAFLDAGGRFIIPLPELKVMTANERA